MSARAVKQQLRALAASNGEPTAERGSAKQVGMVLLCHTMPRRSMLNQVQPAPYTAHLMAHLIMCAQKAAGKVSKKKRKALKTKKAQLKAAAAPAADAAALRKQNLRRITAVSRHEACVQQLMAKV